MAYDQAGYFCPSIIMQGGVTTTTSSEIVHLYSIVNNRVFAGLLGWVYNYDARGDTMQPNTRRCRNEIGLESIVALC